MTEDERKLLEAFIIIAFFDVEYLSYDGQTKWNELAKKMEKTMEV